MTPFTVYDCSLTRCATGRQCTNLRELYDGLRASSDAVIEHNMFRSALEDHFELNEFPNGLARWCWDDLGDHQLGEQLALIDPYRLKNTQAVREAVLDVIEQRLWNLDRVPWCRPGMELDLIESRLIAFETGQTFETAAAMAESMNRLPLRSIYYHVHEARRRTGGVSDDFSHWLEDNHGDADFIADLRSIDFYALNLRQLRSAVRDVFHHHLAMEKELVREAS